MSSATTTPQPGAAATDAGDTDVEFRAVTKRFGSLVAVNAVNLRVRKGEFLSLLGPSGCGKTTSLRLIAGFEQPDEGEILIGGNDVAGTPPYKRDVNTVFQQYALFPHMSILDNVCYGLKQRKVGKRERRQRAGEALELVQLTGRDKHRPTMLSGGQQQRVALARALVMNPRVLLLDEPLGALDLKLRKEMQIELKRIQYQVGITFIYVTHDQEEALSMSDRVAVMSNGRDRAARRAPRDLRPAADAVRGRLHRRHELPRRGGGRGRRRRLRDRRRRRSRRPRARPGRARPARAGRHPPRAHGGPPGPARRHRQLGRRRGRHQDVPRRPDPDRRHAGQRRRASSCASSAPAPTRRSTPSTRETRSP